MDGKRAMRRLEAHQASVAALLSSAHELLEAERMGDAPALASLRWHLMRTLREYQLFKHQEIFDPLAASSDRRLADTAKQMKARCVAIGDAYAAHVRRWSNGTATTASASYVVEARDVVNAINRHLDRERAEAEILLGSIARTRRPDDASLVAD